MKNEDNDMLTFPIKCQRKDIKKKNETYQNSFFHVLIFFKNNVWSLNIFFNSFDKFASNMIFRTLGQTF